MKKILLPLLAAALLLGSLSLWAAPAQGAKELKPVAVLSLSGYDELLGDIEFVGKLSDNPDLAKGLEAMLKLFTKSQGLAGLDKARPWGAVVQTDGQRLTGLEYVFLPVTDLKKLLSVMEPFVGKAEEDEDHEGVFKIEGKKKPLYVKEKQGGWAFVAHKPETLDHTPADPLRVLRGLAEQYDAALRLHVANMPEKLRQEFIAKMEENAEKNFEQGPGEPDEHYAVRKKVSEQMLASMTRVMGDLDQVTVGLTLDHDVGKAFLEVSLTAVKGTESARQIAKLRPAKSNFAGFLLPGAALNANWAGQLPEAKIAMINTMVEAVREQAFRDIDKKDKPEEEDRVAKQLVGDVLDLVWQTAKGGRVDGGLALLLHPESVTLLAGGYVADAAKLEKLAKQVVKIAEAENSAVGQWVKLDADQYKGVRFHTVSRPIPEDAKNREKVVGLIGETLDVVLGIGKQSVYVAAGRDAMRTLKQAIERSAAEAYKMVPPSQFSVSLGPVAQFVAAVGKQKDRPKAARAAEILEQSASQDHIKLVTGLIPQGVKCRLEFEEGVLKLITHLRTITNDN